MDKANQVQLSEVKQSKPSCFQGIVINGNITILSWERVSSGQGSVPLLWRCRICGKAQEKTIDSRALHAQYIFFILDLSHTHGRTRLLHLFFSLWWLGCGQEDSLSPSILSPALSQKVWTSEEQANYIWFLSLCCWGTIKNLAFFHVLPFLLFSFLFSLRGCFIMCPCHIKHSGPWLPLSLQHTIT